MKTTMASILAAAILAGCANTGANYVPLVDHRTAGANYDKDLAECQSYATQRAGAADTAASGAVIGALFGVLLAAAGGGKGYRNEFAAVGAVAGAAEGAAVGEGTQRDIIKRCMAGRGYSVLD